MSIQFSRGPMKTALWPLQQALYERLANDPILSTMVNAVYDEVVQYAKLPYVQIGDDTVNPYDTKTSFGEDTTITLHAWHQGPGKTGAKRIMDAILQAISAAPLALSGGFEVEGIQREFLECLNDGQVYHGICRFRVYIKQPNGSTVWEQDNLTDSWENGV